MDKTVNIIDALFTSASGDTGLKIHITYEENKTILSSTKDCFPDIYFYTDEQQLNIPAIGVLLTPELAQEYAVFILGCSAILKEFIRQS